MINIKIPFIYILFFLGIVLLTINIFGLFISLQDNAIYTQPSGFKDDITLSEKDALKIINQPVNDKEQYVRSVNSALNKRILHYWDGINQKKYNVILPFYENYILYFLTHTLFKKNALHYEFCDYKKTLERGVGFCSQSSTALADILNEKNIKTNVIAWPQHVITEVEIANDKRWIVDPDYGVVIEHSINEVNKNPEIISDYYKKAGYSDNAIEKIIEVYSNQKKQIFPYGGSGYANCNGVRKLVEDLSYILIWLIPLILITPYSILRLRQKYAKKHK